MALIAVRPVPFRQKRPKRATSKLSDLRMGMAPDYLFASRVGMEPHLAAAGPPMPIFGVVYRDAGMRVSVNGLK